MNHRQRYEIDEDPSGERLKEQERDAVRPPAAPGPSRWKSRLEGLASRRVVSIALISVGVAILAVTAYLLLKQTSPPPVQPKTAPPAASQGPPAREKATQTGVPGLFDLATPEQQENERWTVAVARITLKLALAALLATLLAFRPRRESPIAIRNPYIAQTQILLAVVAGALMMVVADNAARAFGIFAAASLVRFRTNIRDPKEITVLLISLAIGLATGVGKVEVAITLSVFSLVVVSLLEYYEPEQIFRAMELTVSSRKVSETDEVLREIFEKRNMQGELRKVDKEDPDNPIGKIVYFLSVGGDLSTDKLSEEIFNSDPDNIDSIQWDQKKTSSYVYR